MRITSLLDLRYTAALEELLFAHPDQGRFRRTILDSVERYGSPKVVLQNGGLRIQLPRIEDTQALFALLENELVGALVYTRTSSGVLEIMHIVVKAAFTYRGNQAGDEVSFQLVDAVCRVGQRIRGVDSVRLAYKQGQVLLLSTKQNSRATSETP